jgi:single-strand DNA-binding protein
MSINKVILVGNVGKDPEVKHLDNNVSVANFTLATSESYTNKGGEKITNTEWHNIVCWRGLATLAENYIKKGRQLYIEGRIRTRTYDAQDGTKRYVTEIYADTVQLLGRKEDNQSSGADFSQNTSSPAKSESQPAAEQSNDEGDDLPF